MSEQLFTIPETLSPRLAWIKKYGISTFKSPKMAVEDNPWCAFIGDDMGAAMDLNQFAEGRTEDDALRDLAKLNGWPLWNEEALCNQPTIKPLNQTEK